MCCTNGQKVKLVVPTTLQFPSLARDVLRDDMDEQNLVVELFAHHLEVLLDMERLAAAGTDDSVAMVLNMVWWRKDKLVRLFLHMAYLEKDLEVHRLTVRVATSMVTRLPDEKLPEDIHQHIRDKQRVRRHKNLSMASAYHIIHTSDAIESRGLQHARVSDLHSTNAIWRSLSNKDRQCKSIFVRR